MQSQRAARIPRVAAGYAPAEIDEMCETTRTFPPKRTFRRGWGVGSAVDAHAAEEGADDVDGGHVQGGSGAWVGGQPDQVGAEPRAR